MKITNLNKKLRLIGTLKLTLELESSLKIKVIIILALIINIIKKNFFQCFLIYYYFNFIKKLFQNKEFYLFFKIAFRKEI